MLALPPMVSGRLDVSDELVNRIQEQLGCRFRGVHVQVRSDGFALAGRVRTYYAKQIAQHLVMRMTNVPIVANDIEVR